MASRGGYRGESILALGNDGRAIATLYGFKPPYLLTDEQLAA
jgi:hypothetical protein